MVPPLTGSVRKWPRSPLPNPPCRACVQHATARRRPRLQQRSKYSNRLNQYTRENRSLFSSEKLIVLQFSGRGTRSSTKSQRLQFQGSEVSNGVPIGVLVLFNFQIPLLASLALAWMARIWLQNCTVGLIFQIAYWISARFSDSSVMSNCHSSALWQTRKAHINL